MKKRLKVGETVELSHGGRLTQIKDFWSVDSKIKLRHIECKFIKFCIDYASKEWWDGFMCGFCSKTGKTVKSQMMNFDFYRVKVLDNQHIPIGYKKYPMGYKKIRKAKKFD